MHQLPSAWGYIMKNILITINDDSAEREVENVRISAPDNPDNESTITVKITDEGMVIDLWSKDQDEYCKNTRCIFWENLIEEMEIEHAMGE